MNYKHFGVMLDCSRNAVMKVSEVKRMIDCLVKMGYDTLELYTEDTYEIEDEPYFGYMRGRYTAREIKEIDSYAKEKGVELIPCIQTLAHFTNLTKLAQYRDIVDFGDILLIDEEKTYVLIEKIFKTLSENFTSRLVNIGMDEAHMVGLGKYLDKHGYQNRFEILLRHLNRVVKIAAKYGFTPHMWSDMFFRLVNNGLYYGKDIHIPKEVAENMPENIELTFWDYYHTEKTDYDEMIRAHKEAKKNIWFAGGAWSWTGFAPLNDFTLRSMKPAMASIREHNIENVLITMWGDNGKECSFYALLPSLYAIRCYANGIENMSEIKQGFFKLFGIKFDDFMLLDIPNIAPKSPQWKHIHTPSKNLLYSDCFMNSEDAYGEEAVDIKYGQYAKQLEDAITRVGEYGYIFETLSSLCRVLELKATLSMRTRKAYKEQDRVTLRNLLNDYAEVERRLNIFHSKFIAMWEKENKPFGWEIQDVRIGGLIRRIKTCGERIEKYLAGEITTIEELDNELLPLSNTPFPVSVYGRLVSVSGL